MALVGTRRSLYTGPGSAMPAWLKPNLAGYWPLDEASGTRRDLSVNGNHLAPTGTPTLGAGFGNLKGSMACVAASTQYVSLADNASLSVEGSDFTVCGWVNINSKAANRGIAGKDSNSAANREWFARYALATDRFTMSLQNSTTAILAVSANNFGSPTSGTWYFYAFTYVTGTRTGSLSVNVGTADTGVATGDITASGADFHLSGDIGPGSNPWDGNEAAWGLWKGRVLTTAELSWLYNNGSGRYFVR